MDGIQLDSLVYSYPPSNVPGFQTLITARQEFRELASNVTEPPPGPGQLYRHQRLIQRYMLIYDRCLLIHRTGTGKTCAAFATSEQFKLGISGAIVDFITTYIEPKRTYIRHIVVLTKGKGLIRELQYQLTCRCTSGEYLSESVRKATSDKTQRTALTREINRYYTIDTYVSFSNALLKNNYSDDNLRELYDATLFIVDEVQNLRVGDEQTIDEDVGDVSQRQQTYNMLWRLFHVCQRTKVMLLSATPMVNNVNEIASVMNLLLPAEQQMPPLLGNEQLYLNPTVDVFEPYFRGKVSYVRELKTGANPLFQGDLIPGTVTVNGQPVKSQTVVFNVEMSEYQTQYYLQASQSSSNPFRRDELQAANFVYPDGTYGMAGYLTYVIEPSKDNYQADPVLLQYISDLGNMSTLSAKFPEIIRICDDNEGNCFVYTNFVKGSGAVLLGLCFEAMGWTRFDGSRSIFNPSATSVRPFCETGANAVEGVDSAPPKPSGRKVFALLTGETSVRKANNIITTFNSPFNLHGDYIKVLIGSPATRIGINLSNVVQIHVVDPGWNYANTYQAISRAIRSTSHEDLLKEMKAQRIAAGLSSDDVSVQVSIFQYVALPQTGPSVDQSTYLLAEQKDVDIRRMERVLKQSAFDCQIHRNRNIREGDVPGSAVCDYDTCNYQCADPDPNPDDVPDLSSYDVLYASELVDALVPVLGEIFNSQFALTMGQLYAYIGGLTDFPDEYKRPRYITQAVSTIINSHRSIPNRYGYESYLVSDSGTLFLTNTYPTNLSSTNYSVATYTTTLINIETESLSTYLTELSQPESNDAIETLSTLEPGSEEWNTVLDSLNLGGKVQLVESLVAGYFRGEDTAQFQAVLAKFEKYIYFLNEPVEKLEAERDRLANRGKGRGRKAGPNSKPKIRKLHVTDVEAEETGVVGELLVVHSLYELEGTERVSYNVTSKALKPEGRLRIFKPAEAELLVVSNGWRDTTDYETPVYNEYIQRQKMRQMMSFDELGIYGTILDDGQFRIVNKLGENRGAASTDARKVYRGKVCKSFSLEELIDFLWFFREQIAQPPQVTQAYTRDQILALLVSAKFDKPAVRDIYSFPDEQLLFYLAWIQSGIKKTEICTILQETIPIAP